MKRIALICLLLCGVLAGSAWHRTFAQAPNASTVYTFAMCAQVPDGSTECDAYQDWVLVEQWYDEHHYGGGWVTSFHRKAKPGEPCDQFIYSFQYYYDSRCIKCPYGSQ